MRRLRHRGFTLIELMIVAAIVALLAGLAFPSYTAYVKKGVRRSAQAQMLDIANREQQFLLANRAYVPYSGAPPSITGCPPRPAPCPNPSYVLPPELEKMYTPSITLGAGSVPAFTVTFTAIGTQEADGNLTYNSEGVKGPASKW